MIGGHSYFPTLEVWRIGLPNAVMYSKALLRSGQGDLVLQRAHMSPEDTYYVHLHTSNNARAKWCDPFVGPSTNAPQGVPRAWVGRSSAHISAGTITSVASTSVERPIPAKVLCRQSKGMLTSGLLQLKTVSLHGRCTALFCSCRYK